jgi:hypothetical protein
MIVVVLIALSPGGGSEADNSSMPGSRNCTLRICVVPTQLGITDTCQLAEHGAVADDDELPGLAIPSAARPLRDLEDVVQNIGGQRVWSKLAHGPQAA